jgi:hypothetical protein
VRAGELIEDFIVHFRKLLCIRDNLGVSLVLFEPGGQLIRRKVVSLANLVGLLTALSLYLAQELLLFESFRAVVLFKVVLVQNLVEVAHIHALELQVDLVLHLHHQLLRVNLRVQLTSWARVLCEVE